MEKINLRRVSLAGLIVLLLLLVLISLNNRDTGIEKVIRGEGAGPVKSIRPPSAISTSPVSSSIPVTPLPELIEPLERVFKDVPMPPEAKLVHQRYEGCNLCLNSGLMALYATDLSPEEVQSFYRNYLQNSAWKYDGEWVAASGDQWVVQGKWPFLEKDLQIQEFTVFIYQSAHLSLQGMPIRQALEKAITLGETVYIVAIAYVQDKADKERKCPPGVEGICENDRWELDFPADHP